MPDVETTVRRTYPLSRQERAAVCLDPESWGSLPVKRSQDLSRRPHRKARWFLSRALRQQDDVSAQAYVRRLCVEDASRRAGIVSQGPCAHTHVGRRLSWFARI